jgi:hypothetical protein
MVVPIQILKWMEMKHLIKILTESVQGTLFGGCVRDLVLKKWCHTQPREIENDRYLIPIDIDVCMTPEEFKKLVVILVSECNYSKVQFNESKWIGNTYENEDLYNKVSHQKIRIGQKESKNRYFEIEIDVIVLLTEDIKPPFLKLDCYCNGLLYNKEKQYHFMDVIPSELHSQIIEDIHQKTTMVSASIDPARLYKIKGKGWNIQSERFYNHIVVKENKIFIRKCGCEIDIPNKPLHVDEHQSVCPGCRSITHKDYLTREINYVIENQEQK